MNENTETVSERKVIVVIGAYPSGTNHFAHAGSPADTDRAAQYDAAYGELRQQMATSIPVATAA